MEQFAEALRTGDFVTALAVSAVGNVNFHNPLNFWAYGEYPVHLAAVGGNIEVMRWLVEVRLCRLLAWDGEPLRTATGYTVLGLAARHKNCKHHIEIVSPLC
jgi:hypothetical protein